MTLEQMTICGGGNGAQTLAAVASHNLACNVNVYAPFADEADRLRAGIASHGRIETKGAVKAQGRPRRISADPEDVLPGSDLVVLVLPAFAHEPTLRAVVPFMDEGAAVGAIPARGGLDFCAARTLEELHREDVTVFGLQTLPWACRIQAYGRTVHVLGVKETVDAATRPTSSLSRIVPELERMLGLPVGKAGNLLTLTLANTGQIIHPGIMYDLFRAWDGEVFDEADIPLFYQGLSPDGAAVLGRLSEEIQAICLGLGGCGLDLSSVRDLKTWLVRSYRDAIADDSSLWSAFVTNRAYASLRAPVQEVAPGEFAPAFSARYLAEDVPYGLMVSQAIADLAGVETPVMDEVVAWALDRLGERAVDDARTPQAYGLEDLDDLLAFAAES